MLDYPKTIEEAREHRYSVETYNPVGESYSEEHCAYEVHLGPGCFLQCGRKKGHGPGKLYCRRHTGIIKTMGDYC